MERINVVVDKLVAYASNANKKYLKDGLECEVISLYFPFVPNNEEAW